MRAVHLYTGTLLIPWILVYAVSTFFISHGNLFQKYIEPSRKFEVYDKQEFVPDETFPEVPAEQALNILNHLDLEGLHRVVGKPTPERMVILRIGPGSGTRILWDKKENLITLEKQPFAIWRFFNYLHFRAGYRQPYLAFDVWGLMVDLVVLSMFLWVISGIYMTVVRPGKKRWFYICLIGGSILFSVLVVAFF